MYYTVHIQHSAHGEPPRMAMLTPNVGIAIDTALEIEKIGFHFENNDGVWVSRLEPGKVYDVHTYRFVGRPRKEFPLVFSRRKRGVHWENIWYDRDIQSEYERARMKGAQRITGLV